MKFRTKTSANLAAQIQHYTGGSNSSVKKLVRNNEIFVDSKKIDTSNLHLLVPANALIEIRKPVQVGERYIKILFDDPYLIAVDKPVGIITSGRSNDNQSSLHAIVNRLSNRRKSQKGYLHVVHRLDQKVSGVLLFAKSAKILEQLQDQWTDVEKTYHALVEGRPPQANGRIESWLLENEDLKVASGPKVEGSKWAVTHYEIEKTFKNYTLLKIRLETGRKNQIRVHLADLNCPIVGDEKYGAKSDPLGRIGLHAYSLKFKHPVSGELMNLHSETPDSFFLK